LIRSVEYKIEHARQFLDVEQRDGARRGSEEMSGKDGRARAQRQTSLAMADVAGNAM
jgi:hypothetical protein